MDSSRHEVIIVGAGPSGSRLAVRLAGQGRDVLVVERKAAAGDDVCCTGIVSRECLDSFAIDRGLAFRPANSARLVAPSGRALRFWRDDEAAYILDRPAFDRALAEQARAAGAEYRFGRQVTDIQVETDRVRVKAVRGRESEKVEAEVVVLATGFGAPFPLKLGLGRIKDVVMGAQAAVETKEVEEVEIYLGRALAPGGFAWLVPTAPGRGLAGMLTRRRPHLYLEGLLSGLEVQGKIASAAVEKDYSPIPLRPLPRTHADRVLVLGEAAGQVKPTTAGGIYYGLLCADIAAGTLERAFAAGDFSAAGLVSYERRWRVLLGRELRAGRRLLRLYRMLGDSQLEWLFRMMERNRVPEYIAGLDSLPFDQHGALAARLFKHLAGNTPLRAWRGLLSAVGFDKLRNS